MKELCVKAGDEVIVHKFSKDYIPLILVSKVKRLIKLEQKFNLWKIYTCCKICNFRFISK